MTPTAAVPTRRISSLDGLRALSIGLVLLGHLRGTAGFPDWATRFDYFPSARLGVRVFFVISGYLISTLLFRELQATGSVSLLKFYYRRTLRIFPAFYAFIAVIAAIAAAGAITLGPRDLWHAATYTMNYYYKGDGRSWYVGHAWSLSVEEQFYLCWPAVVYVFGKHGGLRLALAFVLAAPFIRLSHWYQWLPGDPDGIGETFQTAGDAIATGCLLAGMREVLDRSKPWLALQKTAWFLLAPLAAYAGSLLDGRPRLDALVGSMTANVGIAMTLDWCLRNHAGAVGRVLNWPPLVYVGTLSYSLYLWQQLFLDRQSSMPTARFPVNLALAFALAILSYHAIEVPFLRLRERWEPHLFPGSRRVATVPLEPLAHTPRGKETGPTAA